MAVVGATGWPARTAGLLTVAAAASVALCLGSSTWRQFYWLQGEPARLAGASLVACFVGAAAWGGAPLGTRLQRPGCMGQLVIVLAGLVGGLTLLLAMGSSQSYRETVAAGMDGSDYMFLGLHEFLLPFAMILAVIAGGLVAPPAVSSEARAQVRLW